MSTVNVAPATEPAVVLDPDQADRLRHLIDTVEDWLLHCGDEAHDDLAAFLTGLGRVSSFASRERLVDDLVNDLGEHAVALRTALRHAGTGAGPAA